MTVPEVTYETPDRPLTLEDFEAMPKGAVVRLWYWTCNRGDFYWRHEKVEDDRVHGAFYYDEGLDDDDWSDVSDYLYEFGGYVCRGSGAEPVHGAEPVERFVDCA